MPHSMLSVSALSIPISISEITPLWVTTVLKESRSISSTAQASILEPTLLVQDKKVLSEIHRVKILYENPNENGPSSVVIKMAASRKTNREAAAEEIKHDIEVRFYNELATETNICLPKVHLAKAAPGTDGFVIVMEDLTELELIRPHQGLSPQQSLAAVRALADAHAVWWDRVQTKELEWIPSMIGKRSEIVGQLLSQHWPVFLERFEGHLPRGGAAVGERLSKNYLRLQRVLGARTPWTLTHQNFRSDNILFRDIDAGEVLVIDWGNIGRGPGISDVANILGSSIPSKVRRQHESELVTAYHSRLTEKGVRNYTLEQVQDDYAFAHCLGGLANSVLTGATLDLSNELSYETVAAMVERHFEAAIDHGGLKFVD